MLDETAVIVLDPADNVATAKRDLACGEDIGLFDDQGQRLLLKDQIPFGHKLAIRSIPEGASVVKYGACIGRATRGVAIGEHVHIHNLVSLRGKGRP